MMELDLLANALIIIILILQSKNVSKIVPPYSLEQEIQYLVVINVNVILLRLIKI